MTKKLYKINIIGAATDRLVGILHVWAADPVQARREAEAQVKDDTLILGHVKEIVLKEPVLW